MRQTRGRSRDGIELSLGNGQIVAFVLVALALLGVAFALGIKVGQQIGDEKAMTNAQSADRLAVLDAHAQTLQQNQPVSTAASDVSPTLTASTGTLTFAQELTKPSPNETAPIAPAVYKPESKPAEPSKDAVLQEPAISPEPQPDTEPIKERGSLLAAFEKISMPKSGFALQIASLPNEAVAQEEVRRLTAKGFSAWITEANVKGSTYYRVKVGPYATRSEAQQAIDEVAQKSGARPIVANAN